MEREDFGLQWLLELHGVSVQLEEGYWWKAEAWRVVPSALCPHGVRYSLTLHNKYNTRIFGYDNAHGIRTASKGKFGSRIVRDHVHLTASDKGHFYEFSTAAQLLEDFFKRSEEIINSRRKR
ncbi:toxin-antitoxin system TumE family protein [Buttiauxella agrestis]|uniref:toxin-antitoxin system TumE family protein n=1 Tax=Buttiauxella agrestis TaxID=82977 RepID=UPI0015611526|nr:DUF6516 family protein [Buttiauxella agrestis]BCG09480.1 hypothetical protein BADSM9389_21480 [Buttiauxella agrestis]